MFEVNMWKDLPPLKLANNLCNLSCDEATFLALFCHFW